MAARQSSVFAIERQRTWILSFARNQSNKYRKKLLDAVTITRLDALKTASKTLVHKTATATGELTGIGMAEIL